jgi:hypothetical protein
LFVNGLLFGVWLLGALTPLFVVLALVGVTLYRLYPREEHIDAATFIEDFPPEIPTSEPAPEPKEQHRFIASTIVRPPEISERKEEDDDDTEEGS